MPTKGSRNKADSASKAAYTPGMEAEELPQLYQRLVELSPNGIMVNNGEQIVFANQKAAEILGGATPVDIVGRPMWDFIPTDQKEAFQNRIKAVLDGEDAPPILTAMQRIDGSPVEIEGSTAAVSFRGQPAGLIVFQDVTERVEMQKALEDSERRYRGLFDSAPLAYLPSRQGHILDANPKALETFGYTRDELLSMSVLDLTADTNAGRPHLTWMMGQGRSGNPPQNQRVEMQHKNGTAVWTSVSSNPSMGPDGKLEGRGMFLDITKQVQMERALDESQEKLQTIYDHMREGVLWVTMDGRITHANPATLDMLGYALDEIQQIAMQDIVAPEYADTMATNAKSLHQNGNLELKERIWRRKDGINIPVEVGISLTHNAEGNPSAMMVFVHDLTARKAAQQQLEESEERYRSLFETAPIAYLPSIRGQIIDANPKAQEIFGYTRDELLGMNVLDMAADTPEGRGAISKNIELARAGTLPRGEYRSEMRHKDGTEVWVSTSATPYTNANGELEGRVMYQDITRQVQAERELEDSKNILQTTYDHIREGIVWADVDGQVTHANPSVTSMLGYTLEEIRALQVKDLVPPEHHEAMATNRERSLLGEDVSFVEREWVKKDGSKIPVEVWASTIFQKDEAPTAIILGVLDLTARKAAQQQLKASEEQYRDLFDRAPIAYMPSRNGKILDANPKTEAVFGYTKEELQTMTLYDLTADTPDGRELLEQCIAASRAGTDFESQRIEMRHKDGRELWISVSGAAYITPEGVMEGRGTYPDITEQVMAERKMLEIQKALAQSEARYHTALDHLREGVLWVGPAGQITDANPALQEMLGYTEEEFLALPMSQIVARDHHAHAHDEKKRAEAGEELPAHETVWLKKDGSRIPLEMWTTPIRISNDGPLERMIVVRNLTSQKENERLLRESEERYRGIYTTLRDSVVEMDMERNIVSMNPALSQLTGYSQDELLSMNRLDVLAPSPSIDNFMERILSGEQLPPAERTLIHKDGTLIPMERTITLRRDGEGNAIGYLAVWHDLRSQRLAEEALRNSEERYRRMFNGAPVCYLAAEDGLISAANPKASELLGYSIEELIGQPLSKFERDPEAAALRAKNRAQEVFKGAVDWSEERVLVRKDGTDVLVRARGYTMLNAQGHRIGLGTFEDITKEKQAEEALRRSEERYRAAYNSLGDAVIEYNFDRNIVSANRALERLSGYTNDELLSLDRSQLVEESASPPIDQFMERLIAGEQLPAEERTIIHKDGTRIPVERGVSLRVDVHGIPQGHIAIWRDLRGQRAAEEALRRSEERYRRLFDSAPIALVASQDGIITNANPMASKMFGYSQEELIGMPGVTLHPDKEESAIRLGSYDSQVTQGISQWDDERHMVRKNGQELIVRRRGQLTLGVNGERLGLGTFIDITSQKEAEEALRVSEDRYRHLYESAPVSYLSYTNGIITAANPKAEEMLGLSQEELIGLPVIDLVVDKEAAAEILAQFLTQITEGVNEWNHERLLKRKDGQILRTMFKTQMELNQQGQRATQAAIIDITQQHEAAEALHQSEERYRTIYDLLESGVVQFDLNGRIVGANPSYQQLIGCDMDELRSLTLEETEEWASVKLIREYREKIFAGEIAPPQERALEHTDGTPIPAEGAVRLLTDAEGDPDGFLVVWRDLRQERASAAALRNSQERYHAIYESLNDGVLTLNADGWLVESNKAFTELSGYTTEELATMSLQDLAMPESRDGVPAAIKAILEGHNMEKAERNLLSKEGVSIPIQGWSRSLTDVDGIPNRVFLVARDMRTEHQAQKVNRELAIMEERTRLAREIHDTVAQTLTGLVNQLDSTEYLVPDELDELLLHIGEAKDLARACLTQTRSALLDLQPMELKPGGLTDGIRAEAITYQARGLDVEVKVQGEEPITANERSSLAVFRIVQEALSNSYKHSQANLVTVEIIYGPEDVILQIADDGVGFDVSATRAQAHQGVTGFGMGVMDERSRVSGGEITIVSARGAGTRIIGRIPYIPTDVVPIITISEETKFLAPSDLGTCRVLLVDDHELVRHGTKAWLDMTPDMEVVGEADTGEWAIIKAQELNPDVILMDVHMPSMNGIEATKKIVEVLPECKIILLTVFDDDDHVREGIRAGAKGYMVKGSGRDEILNGIRTVFAGGSLVPASALGALASGAKQDTRPDVTAREREVLNLLASGAPTKEIAATLVVSENTVNYHLRNLYQKLGVKNRTQAIRASEAAGLLNTPAEEPGFG